MLLLDERNICIKDYQEILFMDDEHMTIDMKTYLFSIQGEDLEMLYYDQYEIRLQGKVKVIEYVTNRV